MTSDPTLLDTYWIRRKVFKIFGASFHIYDAQGSLIGFSKQKAFKLKEDIRVFTDETMDTELLTIHARQIIDFSASYDVTFPLASAKVGSVRRKGFRSILRDLWEIFDADDQPAGKLEEDSAGMAMARRFLSNLIPQRFHLTAVDGSMQAQFRQQFNPFIFKLEELHLAIIAARENALAGEGRPAREVRAIG